MIENAIKKIVEFKDLDKKEAEEVMEEIMGGYAKPTQIASLLTALRMKGETIDEITAFAEVMRKHSIKIHPNVPKLLDTCGTGGDNLNTFNISTATAFVVSTYVPVAKHGNKAVSSKSGSADVLEALGVNLNVSIEKIKRSIEELGIGFLFAPQFHPAMKYATPVRRDLGIRTVFNVLGPLTNPANANYQLMGVYDEKLTEKLANVLKNLGLKGALVVHGSGMDEITTIGKTKISEMKNGEIKTYYIDPEDFGIKKAKLDEIKGGNSEENAKIIRGIFEGEEVGAKRDIVVLNSAFALYIADETKNVEEGIKLAEKSIDSGKALKKLEDLIDFYREG
ncbi:anthranilate phosphoribosyltransferase [Methanocaldococcus vulcanius M7]|uniref:Anthranilate phosphoribosyltransferase n=1 Tax=Methanocaldococcus vulcanius (strain ATCC 700851 / DSM 12094 / M7) TaxID=579137 RepID=C9RE03_METVM|nr:anthranilate phosphoribosyltransferase [Methanocaldococcus vulcanius]ACX73532.1 anthranilate phosphoribosyltransferase [Methanocaldococcus vulcanius M7]